MNGTCIFSNAAQNGGISLITSPLHAHVIQEYVVIDDYTADPTPFLVEEIEGKGIGLRANRSIAKGEVIMVRSPVLVAQTDPLVELEAGMRDLSMRSIKSLLLLTFVPVCFAYISISSKSAW